MKTAYELAMERLNQSAPAAKLTHEQKAKIAEVESRYKSKIAEREIFLKGEIAKAVNQGDLEAVEQLEKQLASDRRCLKETLEEKKQKIRDGVG